jgi:hypothetical protein
MKTKVVVSVRRERREEGLGRRSRCFGHGGDARDGFVGFYTAKQATDGLVFQILNSRNRPGDPPVINPGTPINLRAENHLKLLAFYLRHQERISKVVNVANITLHAIFTLRKLRDYKSSYKAPDDPQTINAKDWPKTMESIQEYLQSYLGEHKKSPWHTLSERTKMS